MKAVFLPATAPEDAAYGRPEKEWPIIQEAFPDLDCIPIEFDGLVWYNPAIRCDTLRKITEKCGQDWSDVILVGFSKSGCGAVNLALDSPGRFASVIVFDAPLMNEDRHRFSSASFYPDHDAMLADVPVLRVRRGETPGVTLLVLVHGKNFFEEMQGFSSELEHSRVPSVVINDTPYLHSWNSGWMVRAIQQASG